jgi:hypothetical protein
MNELSTFQYSAKMKMETIKLKQKNAIMHFSAYKSAARRKKYCKWAIGKFPNCFHNNTNLGETTGNNVL